MSTETLFGMCAAVVAGLGLAGMILGPTRLRRIVGCNLLAAGVFLAFGVVARRGAAAGVAADPVPQAMVITGLVVAFAGTALAAALSARLAQCEAAADDASGEAERARAGATDEATGGDAR